MMNGTAIPLARDGLPILGAPIGTSAYCTAQISTTITSMQRDLDLLSTLTIGISARSWLFIAQLSHCVFALLPTPCSGQA